MHRSAASPRKNSEAVFVIRSLSQTSMSAVVGTSPPDITDLAPDLLEGHREHIARAVSVLASDPIILRGPAPKLRDTVSQALARITGSTIARDRVVMLSASGMIGRTPADCLGIGDDECRVFARSVRRRLASSLADTLISRFDADLLDRLGPRAHCELGRMVNEGLATMTVRDDLRHVAALGDAMVRPFREALRLQVGFVAAGADAQARKIMPLTELFCSGNLPLGTMDDGCFLVLVE
jgi:hypothetical protein